MKKTIVVNGKEIKIHTRRVTRSGNLMGFRTNINGEEFFKGVLTEQEAMDLSFASWVKKNG